MGMNKKAQAFTISDLSNIGITLVVLGVILSIGSTIIANIQGGQTINSTAFNASGYTLSGLNTLASYIPTVALVAVAAIVIGIVMVFFARRQ